jgi:Eukaryotic aspartyl protease
LNQLFILLLNPIYIMPLTTSRTIFVTNLLVNFISASPIIDHAERRGIGAYRVHQVEASGPLGASGADALEYMRQRYTQDNDPNFGSVITTPNSNRGPYQGVDLSYLVPVTINGTTFNMTLDTGSSDLWVYSDLIGAEQQGNHPLYKTHASKRLEDVNWQIAYISGASKGAVYVDDVSMGPLTARNQAVEAAAFVSTSLRQNSNLDGILGLGFGKASGIDKTKYQAKNWFETVKPALAQPVFAADLKKGQPGYFDFGVCIIRMSACSNENASILD